MDYSAPIDEMMFVLESLGAREALSGVPGGEHLDAETSRAVLDAAGAFAAGELAPLNHLGDKAGAKLENGVVRTAPGFADAYKRFVDGGWNAVPFAEEHGGQGLPWALAVAVTEMWQAANLAFGLCPLLSHGAVELMATHGTAEQRRIYVPKLVSGAWSGTMNLTEPQAGSDVGAIKTRAVPDPANDGALGKAYRITGNKIFITYGDHDMADNIVHMVLARTPGAPAGSKGISLFLVPKFLPAGADGTQPGAKNDLRCVSLEHKLGISAAPTCVMAFGDDGGALGWLIGEENRGLECMFIMMNNARLSVGLQGVAIAERAYQQAAAYAKARVQSRALSGKAPGPVAIIEHPDVRRMLLDMKARLDAARALTYAAHLSLDLAAKSPDAGIRAHHQARVDLLTPVVKAWSTDIGVTVASLGVQIHGGMGYIEETGAAQYYRDARITPIYEGTNGIQANDLVFRKIGRDGGAALKTFLDEIAAIEADLAGASQPDLVRLRDILTQARDAVAAAGAFIAETAKAEPDKVAAGAVPFLDMLGTLAGGALLAKGAILAAKRPDDPHTRRRLLVARHFADHLLSKVPGALHGVRDGAASVLTAQAADF
ncbi:MAG: acyl-CoA dehydrogenase [Alphaproteobacteria bacterium]|nr:acyl-CoA dehydrogenase [Alphaproteobacteria bacterium]